MEIFKNILEAINSFFANIVPIGDILWVFPQNFEWYANIPVVGSFPFAIILLLGMGIWFSVRTKFVQFRFFKRGLKVLMKKEKNSTGVSPLAAFMLSTAMRVGPGNIIGVTGAISVGGPGAVFWMWISGLFGMASSFVESTLAQIFKEKDGNEYVGGLPHYGQRLLGNKKWVGVLIAVLFIIYSMLSIPIQTFHVFTAAGTAVGMVTGVNAERTSPLYFAIAIILIVGIAIVVFGGIKRVTAVTDKVVPVMAVIYAVIIVGLLIFNIGAFPTFIKEVFVGAFKPQAVFGGSFGIVLAQGIKRGLLSLRFEKGFCGREEWGHANFGGGSGCVKHLDIVGELLDFRKNVPFILENGQYNLEASGYFETKPLMDRGLSITNRTEIVEEFAVYAAEFFCPYNYISGRENITDQTISIHHFSGSWLGETGTKYRRETREKFQSIAERLEPFT